jgi:hypothetical protein
MTRHLALGLALLGVIAVVAGPAFADGGQTIAAATPVVIGEQQFGNTANGGALAGGCYPNNLSVYYSWWSLPVIAGDSVTIDWEVSAPASGTAIGVWATGTTDFTIEQTKAAQSQDLNSNNKAELKFAAPQTGNMPLAFVVDTLCRGVQGPYDFTATIKHGVLLALPRVSSLRRHSQLRVRAHTPDGGKITDPRLKIDVQISTGQTWRTVGTAAVVNSSATVRVRVPASLRSRHVRLRALAHGSNYVRATSVTRRVTVR